MLMSAGILVGDVVVVAMGVMPSFEKRCLSVTEVECIGVGFGLVEGDIFDMAGNVHAVVVEMEVDDLELEVRFVVRLVWSCLNGRLYFLRRLNRMSLEGKMSNDGGRAFGMIMRADFLMELFFFDGGRLGKVTGANIEAVMVEMVVGVVDKVVCANLGMLLQVVILV